MNTAISDLERQLREERATLLAALRARLHHGDDPAQMALAATIDPEDDRATADLLNDTGIALLDHELAGLRAIDLALARIAEGTYGTCAVCGNPIAAERLHAQPSAAKCLHCQQKGERYPHGAPPRL
ncbi:MAG: TraR/DksA family transcriptional regulator [Telluria sp.]